MAASTSKAGKLFQLRRASTSTGHAQSASLSNIPGTTQSTSPSTYNNNASQSHTQIGILQNGAAASATPTSSTWSLTQTFVPEKQMIQAIVHRIRAGLPICSGYSLAHLESDSAMQQIVETLMDHAKSMPDHAVFLLTELLGTVDNIKTQDVDEITVLQSRLYLLKILYYLLSNRIQGSTRQHQSPTVTSPPANTLLSDDLRKKPSYDNHTLVSPPNSILDGQPITDDIAKFCLLTMSQLLRASPDLSDKVKTAASMDSPPLLDETEAMTDSRISPFAIVSSRRHKSRGVASSSDTDNVESLTLPSVLTGMGVTKFTDLRTPETLCESVLSLGKLITKFASHVIFFLSASNWEVVFAKVQMKLRELSKRNGGSSHREDLTEFKVIGSCAMDRARLVQYLQEVSSLFIQLHPDIYQQLAHSIRRAVWSWIHIFPVEFADSLQKGQRHDNTPERLYDALTRKTDETNKRYMWPALTALLAMSKERLREAEAQFNAGIADRSRKKNRLVESLSRALQDPRAGIHAEVALVCYVDLCQAALLLPASLDNVPLKTFAPDLTEEISSFLLRPQGRPPFYMSEEPIDIALYSDALCVLFRWNPQTTLDDLFVTCLAPERSAAVKLVAFRSSLVLTYDMKRVGHLEAQGYMVPLYKKVTPRVKDVFYACASKTLERGPDGKSIEPSNWPRYSGELPEGLVEYDLLTFLVMSMFRADVGFLLYGTYEDEELDNWSKGATKCTANIHPPAVRLACIRAYECFSAHPILQYHGIDYGLAMFQWAYTGAVTLIGSYSRYSIECGDDQEEERLFCGLLKSNMFWWADTRDSEASRQRKYGKERLSVLALAEVAALLFLVSPQENVVLAASGALDFLQSAEQHKDAPRPTHFSLDTQTQRLQVYSQLQNDQLDLHGRVVQQKRVRKLMKKLATPCTTFTSVWVEIFRRWLNLHEELKAEDRVNKKRNIRSAFGSQSEKGPRWSNSLLFLAAFAGSVPIKVTHEPLSKVAHPLYLPDCLKDTAVPITALDLFLRTCFDDLATESPDARHMIKEALGNELHPHCIPFFFEFLESYMQEFFEASLEPEFNQSTKNFLEALMIILHAMLSRSDEPSLSALTNIEFDHTMLIAKYLDGLSPDQDVEVLVLRERFCTLIDSILAQRAFLGFRSECRNELLHKVSCWMLQPEYSTVDLTSATVFKVYRNAALRSLRTSVKLADRLVLQPEQSVAASDSTHVVQGLFREHFSRFMKAFWLQTPQSQEQPIQGMSTQRKLQQKNEQVENIEVQDLIVEGVGNMLLANPEAGKVACLEMALGANSPTQKRYIACLLFSRALQQGTKLGDSLSPVKEYRNVLCELMRNSDLALPLAICEISPSDGEDKPLISALLHIFSEPHELAELANAIVDREIGRAETNGTTSLFRSDSMHNVFLSTLGRSHGYGYLRTLLTFILQLLEELPPGTSLEIDPSKIPDTSLLARNIENLKYVAGEVVEWISSSIPLLPTIFTRVCKHIWDSVGARWPESRSSAVGGFVFLRLICPVLTSPSQIYFELPTHISHVKDSLKAIAKLLLRLATNASFRGDDWTFMNEWLKDHMRPTTAFLREISTFPIIDNSDNDRPPASIRYDEADGIFIHQFFNDNADQLGKELLSSTKGNKVDDVGIIMRGKQTWDRFCAALVEAGPIIIRPRQDADPKATEQRLSAHLRRYKAHDTKDVAELFFQLPSYQENRQTFVFAVRQLHVESVEFELLTYHILKLLEASEESFDIIADCTGFTTACELPIQWIKMFLQLIPPRISSRFINAYIVCANGLAQRYFRKLHSICFRFPLARTIHVVPDFAELSHLLPNILFPSSYHTALLEREDRHCFEGVEFYRDGPPGKLALEIAQSHIKISTMQRKRVLAQLHARAVDIVWLSDITDVYIGTDRYDFVISRKDDRIYLSSDQRDEIVREIKAAKAVAKDLGLRYATTRPFTALDLTATLLHVGLWNTCHENQELRSAALGLLTVLGASFGLEKVQFMASTGIFLPQNPSAFAVHVSDRLATLSPRHTLAFLQRYCEQFSSASVRQKIGSLQYVSAWIKNLPAFWDPTSDLYDSNGSTLRSTVKQLIDLSIGEDDLAPTFQRHIWNQLHMLDVNFVNYVVDLLITAALESPSKCRAASDNLITITSVNVRSKLFSKIRKTLGKPENQALYAAGSAEAWSEVEALLRLCHMASFNSRNKELDRNHGHTADMLYVVTLLAAMGPLSMRIENYGTAMTLMHSLHMSSDPSSNQNSAFLQECTRPEVLRLFGLAGNIYSGHYGTVDPASDDERLDNIEEVTKLMLRAVASSGHKMGLLNTWRSRYMSLVTTTAFQYPLWIKARASVVLSSLTASDVDDDLCYQMLSGFRRALSESQSTDFISVLGMLRCITKLLPQIKKSSSWVKPIVWLAIILLSTATVPLFDEVTRLLTAAISVLQIRGELGDNMVEVLLQSRLGLKDDIGPELDIENYVHLSFADDFSFSLAALLFKGVRHERLARQTRDTLEHLIAVTVKTNAREPWNGDDSVRPIHPDVLGYFVAMLPYATTREEYYKLVELADGGASWTQTEKPPSTAEGLPEQQPQPINEIPRVSLLMLGEMSEAAILFLASFVCTMIRSTSNNNESVMLYTLLADIAQRFPTIVSSCVPSIMDKLLDTVASSNQTQTLHSLGIIFQAAVIDDSHDKAPDLGNQDSYGSLNSFISGLPNGQGKVSKQVKALSKFGMTGLAKATTFVKEDQVLEVYQYVGGYIDLIFITS